MTDNSKWFEDLDDDMMAEVAYGILGRAGDIHNNPYDDKEDVAIELRDLAHEMLEEYYGFRPRIEPVDTHTPPDAIVRKNVSEN